MYSKMPNLVLAFHGCSAAVADRVLIHERFLQNVNGKAHCVSGGIKVNTFWWMPLVLLNKEDIARSLIRLDRSQVRAFLN